MDQKMTGAKKVTEIENQFLCARQPREEIFEFCSCSGLIFMTDLWNFGLLFQDGETFFKKNFWLKSLVLVSTLAGLTWGWIKKPWMTSNVKLWQLKLRNFVGKQLLDYVLTRTFDINFASKQTGGISTYFQETYVKSTSKMHFLKRVPEMFWNFQD